MTARLVLRCEDSVAADVDAIADRTGLPETEVIRRLVRLGLQDIDEVGDEVLFGAGACSNGANTTD